nr:hypothetical protein [Tanacetum cinerariifolium]
MASGTSRPSRASSAEGLAKVSKTADLTDLTDCADTPATRADYTFELFGDGIGVSAAPFAVQQQHVAAGGAQAAEQAGYFAGFFVEVAHAHRQRPLAAGRE